MAPTGGLSRQVSSANWSSKLKSQIDGNRSLSTCAEVALARDCRPRETVLELSWVELAER